MKHKHIYSMLLLAVMLFVSGCNRNNFADININTDELSLTCKGNVEVYYEAQTWQIGYNSARNEYRINDDTMGRYYVLTCSERPSAVGQKVNADLQYTTSNNVINAKNLNFEVQKIDGTGKIWMWNQSKKIGIVIKQL